MADRLSTGLAGLDAQLGGGLLPGTLVVLVSEPMNAQELFGYHFAAAGGPSGCLYLATDAEEALVQEGVKRVGGQPDTVRVHAMDGKTAPADPKDQRFVLDTFSGLATRRGWDEAVQILQKYYKAIRKTGQVGLATVVAGLHEDTEVIRLKLMADGVMELGFDRQGFGLYPYLKVTKMRGIPDSARFLLFKETEKGLFMESTRRVF